MNAIDQLSQTQQCEFLARLTHYLTIFGRDVIHIRKGSDADKLDRMHRINEAMHSVANEALGVARGGDAFRKGYAILFKILAEILDDKSAKWLFRKSYKWFSNEPLTFEESDSA